MYISYGKITRNFLDPSIRPIDPSIHPSIRAYVPTTTMHAHPVPLLLLISVHTETNEGRPREGGTASATAAAAVLHLLSKKKKEKNTLPDTQLLHPPTHPPTRGPRPSNPIAVSNPSQGEPNRTEPGLKPNRTEPNRTEPNRTEPNRTEPNRTESNRLAALGHRHPPKNTSSTPLLRHKLQLVAKTANKRQKHSRAFVRNYLLTATTT